LAQAVWPIVPLKNIRERTIVLQQQQQQHRAKAAPNQTATQ